MINPGELQQRANFYCACLANHLSSNPAAVSMTVDELAHFILTRINSCSHDPMETLAQAFGIAEFICLQRDYLLKTAKEAYENKTLTGCCKSDEYKQHFEVMTEKYNKELLQSEFWQNHAQALTQQVRDLQVELDRRSK